MIHTTDNCPSVLDLTNWPWNITNPAAMARVNTSKLSGVACLRRPANKSRAPGLYRISLMLVPSFRPEYNLLYHSMSGFFMTLPLWSQMTLGEKQYLSLLLSSGSNVLTWSPEISIICNKTHWSQEN